MDFLARLFAYDVVCLRPAFDDDLLQRVVMSKQQDHVSWIEPLVRLNSCVAVWTPVVDSLLLSKWPRRLLLEFLQLRQAMKIIIFNPCQLRQYKIALTLAPFISVVFAPNNLTFTTSKDQVSISIVHLLIYNLPVQSITKLCAGRVVF